MDNNFNYDPLQVATALAEKINEAGVICDAYELQIDGKRHRIGKNAYLEYRAFPDTAFFWLNNYKTGDFYKGFSNPKYARVK